MATGRCSGVVRALRTVAAALWAPRCRGCGRGSTCPHLPRSHGNILAGLAEVCPLRVMQLQGETQSTQGACSQVSVVNTAGSQLSVRFRALRERTFALMVLMSTVVLFHPRSCASCRAFARFPLECSMAPRCAASRRNGGRTQEWQHVPHSTGQHVSAAPSDGASRFFLQPLLGQAIIIFALRPHVTEL